MTLHDLYLLSPEVSLVGLGIFLLAVGLFVSRSGLLTALAVVGLAVPAGFVIALWSDLSSNNAGQMKGIFDTLTVDRFSLFFQLLFIGVTAVVILASADYASRFSHFRVEYYTLILFSTTGMMLLASTTELITIYIALELTTLPVVALTTFLKDNRSTEAGIKFLVLSAISSAVLLYGMVLVFGLTGSTQLSVVAERLGQLSMRSDVPFGSYGLLLGIVLMVAGFGFKIASIPFQMWVPDVYEGAPTPITAFLSVASKAAGFAILLRVFYIAFPMEAIRVDWAALFAILSALSMSLGNLAAISQSNIKRMLAYSTIGHAGYLLVGLAAISTTSRGSGIGPSGVLFYLSTYAATNLTAFFAIIAISNKIGSDKINDYAGMSRRAPFLALVLAFSMISLTGIPPTAGFMAKVYIFGTAVDSGLAWLAVVGVINSVVSAFYYLRVVNVMYLSQPPLEEKIPSSIPLRLALAVTTLAIAFFGIVPGSLIRFAQNAAEILLPKPFS